MLNAIFLKTILIKNAIRQMHFRKWKVLYFVSNFPEVRSLPIWPGPTFIKPDQRNPWIKDQLWNDLLSTILHLQLPNFVSCGRDKPSHMTQNLVTVGVTL